MRWIALFSQTGSEIYNVAKRIHKVPKIIMTNNHDKSTWHPGIEELGATIIVDKHAALMDMILGLRVKPLITLHGYLRILPAEVAEEFNIINGHPGDIVKYPELKGKDPQAKAIELGLPSTGVVLHKVIAEVDAGEILKHAEVDILPGATTEQLILDLKELQLDLWSELLREKLG